MLKSVCSGDERQNVFSHFSEAVSVACDSLRLIMSIYIAYMYLHNYFKVFSIKAKLVLEKHGTNYHFRYMYGIIKVKSGQDYI